MNDHKLLIGLIGAGIQKSLTPSLHEDEARHHGLRLHYQLIDLESTNGTWLNDKPLSDRVALSDGDSLMVGDIPLVAIGGIKLEQAADIFAAGADSVAVVSDVTQNSDPDARVRAWLQTFAQAA